MIGPVLRSLVGLLVVTVTVTFVANAHAEPPALYVEPDMPPAKRIAEHGESPRELRLPRDGLDWGIRGNVGPTARLGIGKEIGKTAFALDVLLGATLPLRRGGRYALLGETGYSFVGFSEHLASFGVGPMVRGLGPSSSMSSYASERAETEERPEGLRGIFAFALVPRFVGGTADGERTLGMRTSVVAGLWLWAVEISHQYLSTDTRDIHQLAFAFSFWPYSGGLR